MQKKVNHIQTKSKLGVSASSGRTGAEPGVLYEPKSAGRRMGHSKKSTVPIRDSRPYPVNIPLKGVSGLYVDLVSRTGKGTPLLDTEDKMLKCLQDIYPIARELEGFKEQTRWGAHTPNWDVLHDVLKKVAVIGNNHGAAMRIEHEAGHYFPLIKAPAFHGQYFLPLPVHYLPVLERANKQLFELVFYATVLVHRKCGVKLWHEFIAGGFVNEDLNDNLRWTKDKATDREKEEAEKLKLAVETFGKNGIARKWLTRLTKSHASIKLWQQAFKTWKPKAGLESVFHEWLQHASLMFEAGGTLNDLIWLHPDYEDQAAHGEAPLTPDQYVIVCWNANESCQAFDIWHNMNEDLASNCGSANMYFDIALKTPADAKEGLQMRGFCKHFITFFRDGMALESKYRDILKDELKLAKALKSTIKPGGKLIDTLS